MDWEWKKKKATTGRRSGQFDLSVQQSNQGGYVAKEEQQETRTYKMCDCVCDEISKITFFETTQTIQEDFRCTNFQLQFSV